MIIIILLAYPISGLITYFIFRKEQFKKMKNLLFKIFWIEKLTHKRNKHISSYKFFSYFARVAMYLYVFFIVVTLLSIISFQLELLSQTLIPIFIFPITYRIIMGFQMFIHGIK